MELRITQPAAVPAARARPVPRTDRAARLIALCDRIVLVAILGSLLLLPAVFVPASESQFLVPKALVLQALVVLAVSALAVKLLAGGALQIRRSPLDLPILAYLAVVLVSVVRASSKDSAIFGPNERSDGLLTLLGVLALFLVAHNLPARIPALRWSVKAVVVSAALVSVEGIAETLGFSFVGLAPALHDFRAYSSTGHPTFLGGLLVWAIPMAAGLLLTERQPSRHLWVLALGLMLICLFATYSRGAWLGAAFASFALLLACGEEVRRLWRWLLPCAAAALLFGLALEGGLVQRSVPAEQPPAVAAEDAGRLQPIGLDRLKLDTSGSGRLHHWQAALELIREQPLFGTGYGNLYTAIMGHESVEAYRVQPGVWVDKVHNLFLDHAASLGIPGLLAYLWLLGAFAFAMWRCLRTEPRGPRRTLLFALVAAWAGYLLHLFFLFDTLETLPLFWVMMALALRETHRGEPAHAFSLRLPAAFRAPAALGVVAGAVLAIYWLALPLAAQIHVKSGSDAVQQGRFDQAMGSFLKAAELNPHSVSVQAQVAAGMTAIAAAEADPRGARHLLDHAVRTLNQAIQRDPEFASLYRMRGEIYTRYGEGQRLGDALTDFRRATVLYPNYRDAHAGVANVARQLGILGETIAAERKLLELQPDDPQTLALLATDYARAGRWKEAVSGWERLIALRGDDAGIRAAMAQTLLKAGQTERANAEMARAQTLEPDNEQLARMWQTIQDTGR